MNGREIRRIAIRYCGGCNPTYERVAAVERLVAAAGDRVRLVGHDDPCVDGVLVVCGCPTACMEPLPPHCSSFLLRDERDLCRALAYLQGKL
jgi:hypothetical protein